VLKTLGYTSGLVMALILGEALLIGLMGGLLGIVISLGIVRVLPRVPFLGDIVAAFPNFGLSPQTTAIGIAIALLLGLAAGFVPALMAYRSRIVDALRQV
jgi:ABC-type antimicrobial peptide transport system permease subunit